MFFSICVLLLFFIVFIFYLLFFYFFISAFKAFLVFFSALYAHRSSSGRFLFIFLFAFLCTYLYSVASVSFFFYQSNALGGRLSAFFIFLSTLVIIKCIFIFNKKLYMRRGYLKFFFFYIYAVCCFLFTTNNIFQFFFFYELLLFPSVFLVLVSGVNKRSVTTAIYFLIWTQLGSFFLFLAILCLYRNYCIFYFSDLFCVYSSASTSFALIVATLLFFAFAIKIPTWPFHFWLTKTHVEASTGFSIFLSGVLVKTAFYGFFKFYVFFFFYKFFFFYFCFMSIIDVVMKLPSQVDYKKIVAYCTIFEMNLMLLNLFFFSMQVPALILYFLLFHTVASCVFFFLVDVFYRSYNTRIVNAISFIQGSGSWLSFFIFLFLFLFIGFPLSIKFVLEFVILSRFFFFNALLFFIIAVCGFFFVVFFFKPFIKVFFGYSKNARVVFFFEKKDFLFFSFFFTFLNAVLFL